MRIQVRLFARAREIAGGDIITVELPQGTILYEPEEFIHHIYFPIDSVVSLISITESGATIEVGMIGNEGMIGIPAINTAARINLMKRITKILNRCFRGHSSP